MAEVLELLEELAPSELAVEGDEVGLVKGSPEENVQAVEVHLDPGPDAGGPGVLVVSHHPVPEPVLERIGSPVVVWHSNWDAAAAVEALAEALGLEHVRKPHRLAAAGRFEGDVDDLLRTVRWALNPPELRVAGPREGRVEEVLVVSGFGLSDPRFVELAHDVGADALVSGDMTHRTALLARVLGVTCVDATHAATEIPGLERLASELDSDLPVPVSLVRPEHPVEGLRI
ncbi:MAG: Nif3-like dinuclear metal center hexameric protein [Methanopyri archaeon]|nr:Nif3-like dinuclear metal center hexameric protein [Methanopyri archaeon]